MLHLELMKHGSIDTVFWINEKPECLLNPTQNILDSSKDIIYFDINKYDKKGFRQ